MTERSSMATIPSRRPATLLSAEDDADFRLLVKRAIDRSALAVDLRFVEDGEQLLDYLHRRGAYAAEADAPRPRLVLLDLNLPRTDGRDALRAIKTDPALRAIPVVVFTTSNAAEDVALCYQLGANAFVRKPMDMQALVDLVRTVGHYWLDLVEPPR
jgi:two-component system response regulator